ncbi:hypothetical protein BKA56DRAFT_298831 [Ilyonectria sp. MPI-CAGE-AT-0026]|nr:hypothetical protein BKA56DRAFT_298831 [Ilyonectria sp. MPI-CAGE-AT-0026]
MRGGGGRASWKEAALCDTTMLGGWMEDGRVGWLVGWLVLVPRVGDPRSLDSQFAHPNRFPTSTVSPQPSTLNFDSSSCRRIQAPSDLILSLLTWLFNPQALLAICRLVKPSALRSPPAQTPVTAPPLPRPERNVAGKGNAKESSEAQSRRKKGNTTRPGPRERSLGPSHQARPRQGRPAVPPPEPSRRSIDWGRAEVPNRRLGFF